MSEAWVGRWNKRYSEGYAFGEEPNDYLKKQLEKGL